MRQDLLFDRRQFPAAKRLHIDADHRPRRYSCNVCELVIPTCLELPTHEKLHAGESVTFNANYDHLDPGALEVPKPVPRPVSNHSPSSSGSRNPSETALLIDKSNLDSKSQNPTAGKSDTRSGLRPRTSLRQTLLKDKESRDKAPVPRELRGKERIPRELGDKKIYHESWETKSAYHEVLKQTFYSTEEFGRNFYR